MANFKEQVAAFEGGEKPRREAKRMVKENYPEIYKANKGIHLTSDKMYIGLSPEVCRYMSMKLNEAGHAVVGDTSMHKLLVNEPSLAKQSDSADLPLGQMYLVVGLLIQGEHSVTPSLYELVDDIKHAGDNGPMAVTHTNAEWLAMIETWRFRDLLRRASIKIMNAIDTAKGREAIQLLTPDEPARNWGKYLSDHIIDWDVQDKVSDEQAAARLDAITKFRAKVAAAFSVWWDHMHPSYSFTHRNLKTILIDNQKTQIAGMKSRMTSWFKEKPWDETQRLRPDDFEKWPGLPLPMTLGEVYAERATAEKRRQEAADRRGDYVIEDDDM
eukprot:jgi/Tetstr1/460961/TSEL_006113.t1